MKSLKIKKDNYGYLFIAPFFITFLVFQMYPIIYSFCLSFVKWDGMSEMKFVGIKNYKYLIQDTVFYQAMGNTLIIWITNFIPQIIFAVFLAVILNDSKRKGSGFFKAIFYLPNIVTAASIGVLFSVLLDWNNGTLNQLLISMGLLNQPINWLNSPFFARGATSLIQWWMWFGYSMIIFSAGMKAISDDIYEAAKVDGASKNQMFWRITLPLLRPTILYTVITSLIGGMQIFDVPMTLTDGLGSPDKSILTIVMYLYNMAFKSNNYGYGATVAYGLFVIILLVSLLSYKFINRKSVYE
ncbi:carbohydrate ABC transporter permease [Clostridium sp.]